MPKFRRGGGDFETPDAGEWQAVCVDVVDRGLQTTNFGDAYQVDLVFLLDPERRDSKGRQFRVRRRLTNSLNPKSNLYKMLVQWRGGQKFSDRELDNLEMDSLIGVNARLLLSHNVTDKGTFANIEAILPPDPKKAKLTVPSDFVREKDRQDKRGGGDGGGEFEGDDDTPF